MEKGFKPQPNCQRRVDSGVLDPCSVRSRAGDTNAVSSCPLPPAFSINRVSTSGFGVILTVLS
jgi:hypothetical protein